MPLVRMNGESRKVNLRGSVVDYADLLTSVARATLRSFVPGPWGPGNPELAAEMIRRTHTPPCDSQCFVVVHDDGGKTMKGCHCPGSGWHYTDDTDMEAMNSCSPNDVWNDAASLLYHHEKQGRGAEDAIYCDCDDMAINIAAVAKYEEWLRRGCPMKGGIPQDGEMEVYGCIAKPDDSNTAHAFVMTSAPLIPDERIIRVGRLFVTDGAARWGMRRPEDTFYGSGTVAPFPVRFSDLAPHGVRS